MEEESLSKTKRKQAMSALQDLGVEIVRLSQSQIEQLPLPETLLAAVLEAKRLKRHEAIRRQMQYIGKLMRTVDAAPIRQQIDAWQGANHQETARLHQLELWRERLLTDESALREFLTHYPHCDAQQLRTLLRNTRKEQEAQRPPANYRALFRWLREVTQAQAESEE